MEIFCPFSPTFAMSGIYTTYGVTAACAAAQVHGTCTKLKESLSAAINSHSRGVRTKTTQLTDEGRDESVSRGN